MKYDHLLADAVPDSLLARHARPPRSPGGVGRPDDRRSRGRRRRLLGPVDRAAGQGARSRPGRGAAGGEPDRLGRLRAQRRVLLLLADPRLRQRRVPLARRDGHPGAARAREPRRDRGHAGALRDRVRLPALRRTRCRDRRVAGGGTGFGGDVGGRRVPRPRGGAGTGRLADVPRRAVGQDRLRDGRSGAAGFRAAGRVLAARRAHPREVAGVRAGARRPDDAGRDAARRSPGAEGGAGDERLPEPAAGGCGPSSSRSTTTR